MELNISVRKKSLFGWDKNTNKKQIRSSINDYKDM